MMVMSSISRMGTDYYNQIASGVRLRSAADGAAQLGIVQRKKAQINGYDMGTRNARDGKGLLNVADGAYQGITESLQRMRELAVQASNTATVSDTDRQAMQKEVDQLKKGISDIAGYTEFNTKKLLDGSTSDLYLQTGPNAGQGQTVDTGDATLQALGIADFDLTKKFDIQSIDDALAKVSSNRSTIGASSNSLDYTIGYNTHTSFNLTRAVSRMEDTDIAKAVTDLNKKQLLDTVKVMMQKRQQEQEEKKHANWFF